MSLRVCGAAVRRGDWGRSGVPPSTLMSLIKLGTKVVAMLGMGRGKTAKPD